MAVSYTYNTTLTNVRYIFRATAGGTVFSANLAGSGTFDYFTDTAVLNDAIYFSSNTANNAPSDVILDIWTAISGTGITLAWEYYKGGVGWTAIHNLKDDTNSLTTLGSNRVRFPHQWMHNYINLNGVNSRLWVRCRISAITTITEGGANTGVVVQTADGSVNVVGGTELAPGNLNAIVTYMNTNYSYVTCTFFSPATFDFRQVSLKVTSYLRSNNEFVLIGNNNTNGGMINDFDYLLTGELVGTKARYGSTFIVYGTINTTILSFGSNPHCKVYGATFNSPNGNAFGYVQATHTADIQYCNFQAAILLADCNFVNCRFYTNFFIANTPYKFDGNSVVFSSANMMYCYTAGWSLKDFDFKYYLTTGSSILCFGYQASGKYNQVWELVNPGTKLNALADTGVTTKPITYSSTYVDLASCKFYDTSAGTYTDYTTQANDDTAGDVPLTGDVGDYYLFGSIYGAGTTSTMSFRFEVPDQANDYEYVWERYTSGQWISMDPAWFIDSTLNLTRSGTVFMFDSSSTATIDGVSSIWTRARIVTKGTATPIATRIRKHNLSCASRWTIQEKYTLDLQVVDQDGANISGATVTMKDSYGATAFTTTTDANGVITQQQFFSKKWYFDPINAPVYPFATEVIYGNMTMTISKTGYETYESKGIPPTDKLDLVIKLNPATFGDTTIIDSTLIDTILY